MKKFAVLFVMSALTVSNLYAQTCQLQPLLKYNANGVITIPMNVSWIGGTLTMQTKSKSECSTVGQNLKIEIESEPEALKLVSGVQVTYGPLSEATIEILEIKSPVISE